MVEGPGHVPFHLIAENLRQEKEPAEAPFTSSGRWSPTLPGYDHITSAIGGTMAATTARRCSAT